MGLLSKTSLVVLKLHKLLKINFLFFGTITLKLIVLLFKVFIFKGPLQQMEFPKDEERNLEKGKNE
jgi:hypothetical protein